MELTKNHLAVAKFAATSQIREELASVLIKDGKVTATDSFRLVELDLKDTEGDTPVLINAKALGMIKGKKVVAETSETGISLSVDGMAMGLPSLDVERYPEYEKTFPTTEPEASVRVNARYLAEVLALLAKLDPFEAVTLELHGQMKPVMIISKGGGRGLVMPMTPGR